MASSLLLISFLIRLCLTQESIERYHGLSLSAARSAMAYDAEDRLFADLLNDYNNLIIPRVNESYSLKVSRKLSPHRAEWFEPQRP